MKRINCKGLIYLAGPYSHPDSDVREARFNSLNTAGAWLMGAGNHVFSPISHGHPIALAGRLPLGHDYWRAFTERIMAVCSLLVVLRIPGWEESTGVQAEAAMALHMGIPILHVDPEDLRPPDA